MLPEIRRRVGQFAGGTVATGVKAVLAPTSLGSTALLLNDRGQVGLVRHSYIVGWSFPGGAVKRAEPPAAALMRELREELGELRCDPPVLLGLFVRPSGWATNTIVLYRVTNAQVDFRPNLEIRELIFVDPAAPPAGTTRGTLRRLAEFLGKAPQSPYW